MNGIMRAFERRENRVPNRRERRALVAATRKENKAMPKHLVEIEWRDTDGAHEAIENGLIEAWRSRDFLVQVYDKGESNVLRMTVSRTESDVRGNWKSSITWDELQRCKREIGRGHLEGFEVFPAEGEVVNVANMRHVWIFKSGALPFGFNRKTSGEVPSPRASLPSDPVAPM